jgi:hypothetical protein
MEFQICPEQYQTANRVLMIRPSAFGYHPQAAASNAFMHEPSVDEARIAELAIQEVDGLVEGLRAAGVEVLVYQDTRDLPDCVFPNNWMSWHTPVEGEPVVISYPMCDELRRAERSTAVLDLMVSSIGEPNHLDLSGLEEEGEILEGTGSLVLDRLNGLAFGCVSPRTTMVAFEAWCDETGYTPIAFEALDANGERIYHTNVMLSVGERVAVVCNGCITDAVDRERVLSALRTGGRQLIEIGLEQMELYCGNILELADGEGNPVLAMSTRAWEAFTSDQKRILEDAGTVVHVPIPTIEDVGGGSVRCMSAELGRGMGQGGETGRFGG